MFMTDKVQRTKGDAMVRHIDLELQELKDLVLQMGGFVENALECASGALLNFSREALMQVQKHESKINELQIRVDEACVNLLAKQAPVARDLRLVIAIVKINTDLERMGDQSVNIALTALDFSKCDSAKKVPPNLILMVQEVKAIVRSALDSFARQDVNLAHDVLTQDDIIDDLKERMIQESRISMEKNSSNIEAGLSMIMSARNLERLADHATNIAEEVIYLATGADVRHGHANSN
jgi:phosphate transport system protein